MLLPDHEQQQDLHPVTSAVMCHQNIKKPNREAADHTPQGQQTYLCRWSHSPRSLVCRCSCAPGQCWCRWHSHHSGAARFHIHRVLFSGRWGERRNNILKFGIIYVGKISWNSPSKTVTPHFTTYVGGNFCA